MALARWLKQSTAVTIKVGPFVDETDGKTAETALTLSQADFRLSKNGGDFAQKNDNTSGTHDEIGYYDVAINATDTNTLGSLTVAVHESGALPVRLDYQVVPANVWDSFFGADYLQVDAVQMEGADFTDTLDTRIDTRIDALETAHGAGSWEGEAGPDEASFWTYAGGRTITGGTVTAVDTGAIDAASFTADAIDDTAIADGAITAAKIASGAIDDDALATDTDIYQARVYLFDDDTGTTDRYVAIWHKNGAPVTSGITSPLIQVYAVANGADLIASTAMTQIASTGTYRYNATGAERTTSGAAYIAKVTATIDGAARDTYVPVGRDT